MNKFARIFLVALRIAIGWHFLYEGVFKIESHTGSAVYLTSQYALQTQTERLRDYFERTPPEQLAPATALARVDEWHDNIVKAFAAQKALAEDQKARLAALRDEVKLAALDAIQDTGASAAGVVNFDWPYVYEEVLKVQPLPPSEAFTSLEYLQASAGPLRGVFRGLVPDIEGLKRLTPASVQARLDSRCEEILKHYAQAGKPFTAEQQAKLKTVREAVKSSTVAALSDPAFQARLADYAAMQNRVDTDSKQVRTPFGRERLDADRKKLDLISAEMLALVNEPLDELAAQTLTIATVEQLAAGPAPRPSQPSAWIDASIQWALTLIGICLMLGIFTPVAALAAAAQLVMFYFASPPWPGLPAASTGGHYLYIDRNLIEMFAALVVATTGSGAWAGLDAYLAKFWSARSAQKAGAASVKVQEDEAALAAVRS